MKFSDIKTKDRSELEELLKEYQVKLGQLSFERVRKTLKKSSDVGKTRKVIAQIKTILHGI
ncbi:MAG: 50S ribosomal protein L29 [Patescibacteria group bacterium]